jgi:hypothetical protein
LVLNVEVDLLALNDEGVRCGMDKLQILETRQGKKFCSDVRPARPFMSLVSLSDRINAMLAAFIRLSLVIFPKWISWSAKFDSRFW